MVNAGAVRAVFVASILAATGLVVAPSAAAHDPDCAFTFHEGTIQIHHDCDPWKRDESECFLTFKVLFVHQRVFCE